MTVTENTTRRRPLSVDMFRAKQAPSLAKLPDVERLARKIAEMQSAVLSSFSPAPWRVTVDNIAEQADLSTEDQGQWARVESAAGSLTFHQGFDRPAVSALCECALGGTGSEAAFDFQGRPLSSIEKDIAQNIGVKLAAGLADALSQHLQAPVSLFDGAIASDDAASASGMLIIRFIANVFGYSGEIRMALPKAELMAQFEAVGASADEPSAADDERAALQRRIGKAESQLIVSLAEGTMLVEEITALEPGRLVRLAATTAEPVVVSSGGTPLFSASLARSGEYLAVRIMAPIS